MSFFLRHSRPPVQPLLTWRGLQAWAVGRRASGLCKLFVRIRARPKFRLARLLRRKTTPTRFFIRWLANAPNKHCIRSCLPSCLRSRDAEIMSCGHGTTDPLSYARVKTIIGDHEAPKITRLGSHSPERLCCLQRQSSSRSSEASASSSTALLPSKPPILGSPSRLPSKLKGTCARIVSAAQHNGPCICELVAGNQFLMHLTAAPVVGGAKSKKTDLNPSTGLANASLRQRNSDMSDRIVFFK